MNPRPQHYWSAIEAGGLHSAFLQDGHFYNAADYGPLSWEGGFAVVFKWRHPYIAQDWAVRFFIKKDVPTLREVYDELSKHLAAHPLPYFVRTLYEPNAISVGGKQYPVVVMPWVDALPLKTYLSTRLADVDAVRNLAERWRLMLKEMRATNISHGDFHHDNVHVNAAGELVLLDYDGVTVPSLVNKPEYIGGTPGYQHPARKAVKLKNLSIDAFSGIVVYLSLRMIAEEPELWKRLHIAESESLVFTQTDFLDPDHSIVFQSLLPRFSGEVHRVGEALRSLLRRNDVANFPDLEDVLETPAAPIRVGPRETALPDWLSLHPQPTAVPQVKQRPTQLVPPRPQPAPVRPLPLRPAPPRILLTERLKRRALPLLVIAIIGTLITIASIIMQDSPVWLVAVAVLVFAGIFAAVVVNGGRGS